MKTDGFDTAVHAPLLLHACKPATMMYEKAGFPSLVSFAGSFPS